MSNREILASVISDRMNTERAKIAMEVMDSFDRYIVNNGISEVGLYEIDSIIIVSGLISRVKTDKSIKIEYKGKLFFLERGLFHYRNILVEMQNRIDAEDAWKEEAFNQENSHSPYYSVEDTIITDNDETYDEQRIAQMLNDPEGFIRSLSKLSRSE